MNNKASGPYRLDRFSHWRTARQWGFAAWLLASLSEAADPDADLVSLYGRIAPQRWIIEQGGLPQVLSPMALRLVAHLQQNPLVRDDLRALGVEAGVRLSRHDSPERSWARSRTTVARLLRRSRPAVITASLLARGILHDTQRDLDQPDTEILEDCAETIHGFTIGRAETEDYLNAVHRLLTMLRRYSDSEDLAYFEIALIEAAFIHPLLVLSHGNWAVSLPMSISINSDGRARNRIIDGCYAKALDTSDALIDPKLLWSAVFPNAADAARTLLVNNRRHFGREEIQRLQHTTLTLDLRPADAVLDGFGVEMPMHDRSAGAAFLAGAAAALIGRSPPSVACTGDVERTDDGYRICSVAGLDAKFRYAAASRQFETFCHPIASGSADASYEGFQSLLEDQDREHLTLARTATADDVLDVVLGQWRRYRFVRSEHLRPLTRRPTDSPEPRLVQAFRDAPCVWSPTAFDVVEILQHLRNCGAAIAAKNRVGEIRGVPGIAYTVLGLMADDAKVPMSALLWDLAGASAQSFLDFCTARDDAERIALLANEAFRIKLLGGLSNARGPDILILVGWPDYLTGSDDLGRPGDLARLLLHPDAAILRDERRNDHWRALIGDVRVILIPDSRVERPHGSIGIEESIVISRMSAYRDALPATRLAAVFHEEGGPFDTPSELEIWIEENLASKQLARRMGGRWILSPAARVLAREAFSGDESAEMSFAIAQSYAPQVSGGSRYVVAPLSGAVWGTDLYEFIYHYRRALEHFGPNRKAWHSRWITSVFFFDLLPTWDAVRLLASLNTRININLALDLGRRLADHSRWDGERLFAEPGAFTSMLRLIERVLVGQYPISEEELERYSDTLFRSGQVVSRMAPSSDQEVAEVEALVARGLQALTNRRQMDLAAQ